MNALFHRAKHWQLFVILVGGVLLTQVLGAIYMSSVAISNFPLQQPPKMSGVFWFFIPMILIILIMTSGWQWSVGAGLRHKLPRGVHMNFRLYRTFTIVAVLYPLIHMSFILFIFSSVEDVFFSVNPLKIVTVMFSMMIGMIIMIPFALFAIFCVFYNFYFCAKTLKSIELGREAELNDYIGYYFLFCFPFVGYWFIQPSVNQITAEGWTPPPTPPGYEPIIDPDPTFAPIPEKEVVPRGELLNTKNHEAFEHDDDFDGLF